MKAIYLFLDYKDWIRSLIHHHADTYGFKSKLAAAANCQRSYLSQTLTGKPHLTPDQLLGIAQLCNLSPEESEYLLDLYAFEKASTPPLKKFYTQRIERARKRHQDVGKRIKKKTTTIDEQSLFYSNWMYCAIYTCAMLEKCRTPEAIAIKLSLPLDLVQAATIKLTELGLFQKNANGYQPTNTDIHLSKGSSFLPIHLRNWRDRAVEHSATRPGRTAVHYSGVYTISKKDFDVLVEQYLQVIERTREQCMASKNENEIVCFNLDWFKL
jgi:uncharacterized protein (TIGR02147 family)